MGLILSNRPVNWIFAVLVLVLVSALPEMAQAMEAKPAGAAPISGQDHAGGNHGRLPYHLDSGLSLAILLFAVAISVTLNAARRDRQILGTRLAALACFVLVAWFVFSWLTGYVQQPRPAQAPLDHIKPLLLWAQSLVALVAGLFLLRVARRQDSNEPPRALPLVNTANHYGLLSRHLHWVIAILFLALIPMGIYATMIPEDVWYRQGYYVAHKTLGFLVVFLVIVRLIWRKYAPVTPLSGELKVWERKLAHGVHISLYLFMLAFPITGFIMSTFAGKLSHFFIWDTPLLWAADETWLKLFGLLHKIVLPYLFYLLIGAHIVGVLKHRYMDGDKNAFRRMVS